MRLLKETNLGLPDPKVSTSFPGQILSKSAACKYRRVSLAAGDWKRMPELDRLVIVRALRPDRLTAALSKFVAGSIGPQFIASQPFSLERSFQVGLAAVH